MHSELWSLVISGAVLGFWAGIAPGPLLTLVISETLCHGLRAGAKVACAPLITDLPIIALTVFVLAGMSQVAGVLGWVSIAGAVVLLWMAWDTFQAKVPEVGESCSRDRALQKGILTNFCNPHPYLFWLTVGSPLLFGAYKNAGAAGPALFLVAFYAMIVLSKLGAAFITARSRAFLSSRAYVTLLRLLGAALVVFAFLFARDGWRLLAT